MNAIGLRRSAEQAPEAHRRVAAGSVRGRLVLDFTA
jgi:hypothetical protein